MEALKPLIDKAKADGHSVFSIKIGGKSYVYRSINRKEFRQMQDELAKRAESIRREIGEKNKKDGVVDNVEIETRTARLKEEGEELVVMLAVLSDPPITPARLDNFPAGVISSLSDRILMAAGFDEKAQDVEPTEL